MPAPRDPAWWLIVPAKGAPLGKTRLAGSGLDRHRLSRALALDSIETAAAVVGPERIVVVSDDPVLRAGAEGLGCHLLADPGAGLNGAIRHAHNWIRSRDHDDSRAVAVLLGDVPAARPADLGTALTLAGKHERAFVPDRDGRGTVLLTDRSGVLEPAFGAGSADRHEQAGYVRLDLDLPRLRTDVDLRADLDVVAALGCGRHTRAVLDATSVS
ncbi:MAG: 2-phospho-L-lactate guanylyltransferase [Tetrasphaera sp.]